MNWFPKLDFQAVFIEPWSSPELIHWNSEVIIMGILVAWSCGLVGAFIVIRRMALMGDAISHGILPGLVISFLVCGSLAIGPMLFGACIAGLACSYCIEWLRSFTNVRQDAAMALVFTTFFAFGVTLINLQTGHLDIDTGCILYGEIGLVPLAPEIDFAGFKLGNQSILIMGIIFVFEVVLLVFFYKQLLITSFDPTLALSTGWSPKWSHFGLMTILALCTVASLEAVGVILVVAMLIFPSVTASFFFERLPAILFATLPLGILYSIIGFHLAHWLDCSIAAAMVVAATLVFIFSIIIGKNNGMIVRRLTT